MLVRGVVPQLGLSMSKDSNATLRTRYTGESYTQAQQWLRRNGRFRGLVPDADDPQQIRLEAAALLTLARPAAGSLPPVDAAGTLFGLAGTSPGADELVLLPAHGLHGPVLARLLPSLTTDGAVVGIPGLRVFVDRASPYLWLRRLGEHAALDVLPSRRTSATAAREDVTAATLAVQQNGLSPLWDLDHQHEREIAAWRALRAEIGDDGPRWSRALRRGGLFLGGAPGWRSLAPTDEEVRGPKPDQLVPRPVAPEAAEQVRGVVAVASADGRGGRGCTTLVLALAGALARSGVRVVVLAGDDPVGVFAAFRVGPPQPGVWAPLPGGVLRQPIMLGSLTREIAERQVTAAREEFDVVLIDAGTDYQHRELASSADIAVLLAKYSARDWGYVERVDHRPEEVRFFEWLSQRADEYFHRAPTAHTDRRRLLNLLTEELQWYQASALAESGEHQELVDLLWSRDPAAADAEPDGEGDLPYDPSDPEDVEDWWNETWSDSVTIDLDTPFPAEFPTPGDPRTRERQRALVEFLTPEGQLRHGAQWTAATTEWLTRPLEEIVQELTSRADRTVDGLLDEVEEPAVERWGPRLWHEKRGVWAAAREAGDDLVSGWADMIEHRHRDEPAEQTAQALTMAVWQRPETTGVLALMGRETRFPHHRLAAVRKALPEGLADVLLWPEQTDLREAPAPELLSHRSGPASAAANRAAQTVVRQLRLATTGTPVTSARDNRLES